MFDGLGCRHLLFYPQRKFSYRTGSHERRNRDGTEKLNVYNCIIIYIKFSYMKYFNTSRKKNTGCNNNLVDFHQNVSIVILIPCIKYIARIILSICINIFKFYKCYLYKSTNKLYL